MAKAALLAGVVLATACQAPGQPSAPAASTGSRGAPSPTASPSRSVDTSPSPTSSPNRSVTPSSSPTQTTPLPVDPPPPADVSASPGRYRIGLPPGVTVAPLRTVGAGAQLERLSTRTWIIHDDGAEVIVLPARVTRAAGSLDLDSGAAATTLVWRRPAPSPEALSFDLVRLPGMARDIRRWERRGVDTISVIPRDQVRGSASEASVRSAWAEIRDRVPAARRHPGLEKQLRCHMAFAPDKEVWNLEIERPDVSYLETVQARCNPGDSIIDPDLG